MKKRNTACVQSARRREILKITDHEFANIASRLSIPVNSSRNEVEYFSIIVIQVLHTRNRFSSSSESQYKISSYARKRAGAIHDCCLCHAVCSEVYLEFMLPISFISQSHHIQRRTYAVEACFCSASQNTPPPPVNHEIRRRGANLKYLAIFSRCTFRTIPVL
jgi:hypothetical protein